MLTAEVEVGCKNEKGDRCVSVGGAVLFMLFSVPEIVTEESTNSYTVKID